jgi:hypothetical protein
MKRGGGIPLIAKCAMSGAHGTRLKFEDFSALSADQEVQELAFVAS